MVMTWRLLDDDVAMTWSSSSLRNLQKFFLEFLCFLIGVRAEESVAVSDWHGRSQLKFERDFDLEFSVD